MGILLRQAITPERPSAKPAAFARGANRLGGQPIADLIPSYTRAIICSYCAAAASMVWSRRATCGSCQCVSSSLALITQLEHVMADVVSAHWPSDAWFAELSQGRHAKPLSGVQAPNRAMNHKDRRSQCSAISRISCRRLIDGTKSAFLKGNGKICVTCANSMRTQRLCHGSDRKRGATALVNKFEAQSAGSINCPNDQREKASQ